MTSIKKHGHSMPLIPESRINRSSVNKNIDEEASATKAAWEKLPTLKISKIMQKIGAGDRKRQMYIPNQQDQAAFKKSKWLQLSRQYSPHRYESKQEYEGELDQIVLGCYDFNLNRGRKTVWKKYREHCDDLSFDTLKVIKKKI